MTSSGRLPSKRIVLGLLTVLAPMTSAYAATDLVASFQKAAEQNPSYLAAKAQYRADIEARPQALSKVLPQLGAVGGFSYAKQTWDGDLVELQNVPEGTRNALGIDPHIHDVDSYKIPQYSVQLTQTLFNAQDFIGLQASNLQVAQAKLALDSALSSLTLSVSQAYIGVLAGQDQLHYAKARLDQTKQQLAQSEVRHSTGLLNDADFDQVKTQYQLAQAQMIRDQSNLQIAQSRLALLTGEAYSDVKTLPDSVELPSVNPEHVDDWVSQAVTQNLTVLIDKLSTHVAKLDYDKAKSTRYPVVSIVGEYSYEHPTGGYPGPHEEIDQRIGVQVKQALYTGGAIDSSVRAAKANWDKAAANEDLARNTAVQDTKAAFFNAQSTLAQIEALKQAVIAGQSQVDATRVQFEVGTRNETDLLQAIEQLYRNQSAYAQARYQYLTYTLQLKQAVGTLSVADLQSINQWLQ